MKVRLACELLESGLFTIDDILNVLNRQEDFCRCHPDNPHYAGYDWEKKVEVTICAACARYRKPSETKTVGGCECGSEKVYGPNCKHSTWCPRYAK